MVSFQDFSSGQEKICVVGLGYVGLPLAIELAKHFSVIGLDIKPERIAELKSGFDRTREVGKEALVRSSIQLTSDPVDISGAKFIIVAVPTPVDEKNLPDLMLVEKATETVGKHMVKNSVVVYESTVYPGVTEDICLPILEKFSGLTPGKDFKIGYSPERVNPGDKEHTIERVTKVVSGMDVESLELIANVYGSITNVFKATSIKVAEAAKVIENTQRDINIALMNELALIFNKMDMSVYDVLEAAGTKWNFLKFVPGLVGGHCIGVDPYYLTYKAQKIGYNPEVILSGRRVNDSMPFFIASQVIEQMKKHGKNSATSAITLAGITFKENVPDSRNSKAWLIYKALKDAGLELNVHDPHAYDDEVAHEYGIELTPKVSLPKADVLIIAVSHDMFKQAFTSSIEEYLNEGALIVDIKRILNRQSLESKGYHYWTL